MDTVAYTTEILHELQQSLKLLSVSAASSESLVEGIVSARHIFVAGAGRSGLMAKAFAMRLMHLGLKVYVVGETVTPGIGNEDLLLICSGSGETKSLLAMAQKASALAATVAVLTISPHSSIGQLSSIVISLPGAPKDHSTRDYATIQPMGSLFEQTLLLYLDGLILSLMEKQGLDSATMYGSHANLE